MCDKFMRKSKYNSFHHCRNQQSGFSLLELLIVGALLAIIFISVSGLMMSSLTGSIRTSMWQELRTEGSYAMTQMAFLIRNSNGIIIDGAAATVCDGTPQALLQFDNPDDTKSLLTVNSNNVSLLTIADDQVFGFSPSTSTIPLLSEGFLLQDPNIFTCSSTAEQPYVKITFSLTKPSATLGDITQDFRRTVILRNQ